MANGHGGPRTPARPAAVSGPGRLSKRTDGGPAGVNKVALPDAKYGEQSSFDSIQGGAPLNPPSPQSPQAATPAGGPQSLTPLNAATTRPNEPVTSGAPVGAGVGPAALGLPDPSRLSTSDAAQMRAWLPTFIARANDPGATQSFRDYVIRLRAELTQ